jgi:hypothetical protein
MLLYAVRKLKLDAVRCANYGKSADPIFHLLSPLLKNRCDATGDFKNQRGVGLP